MMEYIVTAHYATWSGDMRSCRLLIAADSHADALNTAADKIKADKRRNFMGKLSMDCAEQRGD